MNHYLRPIAVVLFAFHFWLAWVAHPGVFIPLMTCSSIGISAIGMGAWVEGPGVGRRWLNALPLTATVLCSAYLVGYFVYLMVP
jgi:hypothetical protein